jgi:hypothetical protein
MSSNQLRIILALLLFAAVTAPAAVLYVDLNSASPTPPYTNWATAATNIQDAVDAAVASDVSRSQPLAASLRAALASIDRSNPISAANQLLAFQNQLRAQIEPLDDALASSLIQSAQEVIYILSDGITNASGRPHGRFTSVTRQANGQVRMQFSGEPAQPHIIEASVNLPDWERIGAVTTGSDGSAAFADTQAAQFEQRFYRAVLP